MLLILVLAQLFCPSLAEEEFLGVKKICGFGPGILYYIFRLRQKLRKQKKKKKKGGHSISTKDPPASSIAFFGFASPIMIFLPPEGKVLPSLAGCGRGGIRTPDTVVRSHVL